MVQLEVHKLEHALVELQESQHDLQSAVHVFVILHCKRQYVCVCVCVAFVTAAVHMTAGRHDLQCADLPTVTMLYSQPIDLMRGMGTTVNKNALRFYQRLSV